MLTLLGPNGFVFTLIGGFPIYEVFVKYVFFLYFMFMWFTGAFKKSIILCLLADKFRKNINLFVSFYFVLCFVCLIVLVQRLCFYFCNLYTVTAWTCILFQMLTKSYANIWCKIINFLYLLSQPFYTLWVVYLCTFLCIDLLSKYKGHLIPLDRDIIFYFVNGLLAQLHLKIKRG